MVSGLAGAIGSMVGASRMIYSMAGPSRQRENPMLKVSKRYGTPIGAIGVAFVLMAVSVIAFGWVLATPVFNAWAWVGVAVLAVIFLPGMVRRIGEDLSSDRGLAKTLADGKASEASQQG